MFSSLFIAHDEGNTAYLSLDSHKVECIENYLHCLKICTEN